MTKILKGFISAIMCITIIFTSCGCSKPNTVNSEGWLELVDSPATTLNNVWYNTGGIFRCAIFESLLIPSADMSTLNTALAQKYSVSSDGLSHTFLLRDDVTWHDGEKFNASDVEFSIKTALRREKINGIFTTAFMYIEGAEAYSNNQTDQLSGLIIDGNEVTIRLTSPNGNFLNAIAQFAILPEHLLSDTAPNDLPSHEYWKKPIGLGCYRITEAVEGEYFHLEAYDNYYGEQPGIRNIHLRLNTEDCVSSIENGTLDFYVTNDPEEIARLKGSTNCKSALLNILFPTYLIMNLTDDDGVNDSLKDVNVRKALLLAIDRDTIVEAIFPGSSVTDTLVPAWDNYYLADGETYEFNPDKAKKMLMEAGFDFSKPIRLRYSVKGQATSDLMNAIAVYWRAIGITVDLQRFEGSGSEHMFKTRDFDVCYKRLSAFDHASIYEEIQGDGIMQTSLYNQPVYDELISTLSVTSDETIRKDIISRMQMLDQQYMLRVPLFALANVAFVNESRFRMPDVYGNLWYRYDLRFEDWKLVN